MATILVDKGTLKVGDPMVAGAAWGTVRAIIDDKGQQLKEAGPSMPVQVLGLSVVPGAGDEFRVAPDLKTAKTVAEAREQRLRLAGQRADARVQRGVKLEDIFDQIQRGEVATLNLVLKADVQGSLEALTEALRRLERDDVKLAFVHRAVGGITENDITLAATTNATIIGFNVRPDRKARELADAEDVEIRTYEIIYQVLEDIEKAMVGLLAPEFEEVVTGDAEVREIFRIPRVGAIAGCYVQSGVITRGSKVRFLREGVIIWKGTITSLKRFKDDAREVREGFECGIGLSDFQDLKPGDVIETFEEREIPRGVRCSCSRWPSTCTCRRPESLKDKRMVVKSIVDGARHRFRVAAAEVGSQDQWQRAALGFAAVAGSAAPRRRGHRRGGPLHLVAPRDRGGVDGTAVVGVSARRRPPRPASARQAPRTARLNELLREVVGEELMRIDDERLELVSVTAIDVDNDLNRAIVYFDSLAGEAGDAEVLEALGEHRRAPAAGHRSPDPRPQDAGARVPARRRHPLGRAHRADPARQPAARRRRSPDVGRRRSTACAWSTSRPA